MPDYDQNASSSNDYNSMQAQVGLIPPFAAAPPPMLFPGQVSAMMAQGGVAGAFAQMQPAYSGGPPQQQGGNMWGGGGNQGPVGNAGFGSGQFPTQQYPTFTTGPSLTQFPTGVMMPNMPGAPYNPYGAINSPPGGYGGSLYGPSAAYPPPAYAGAQGRGFPFGPNPASPMFNTPFAAGMDQYEATQDRLFSGGMSAIGIGARVGGNLLGGAAGAALGRKVGGGWGAAIGGGLGILGAEQMGVGRFAQNAMMDYGVGPSIGMHAYGTGIEQMSRGFVSGGAFGHSSGAGFSRAASFDAANMLGDMAGSQGFRRETQDRFNTSDVMRIAQGSAQSGMMEGVQSPEQMRGRVREIARSLSAFMELAQEPDLQRAISTMGQLRASGLNLNDTMNAVRNGRTFARMAGTTFEQMASTGGAMGGQTYQAMGLGQGLGFQVGMGNMAQAQNAANQGRINPTLMGLMGGPQGYANLNNAYSASFMQLPMLAPAMMGSGGGLNASSIQNMMSGQTSIMGMAGQGANNLSRIANRFGVEGLGGAIAMQPYLQTQIGHLLEQQGPFARRNMEDKQVFSLMKEMNMRGSQGFMTAAQTLGMSREQAMARAQEMTDPRYFNSQRDQIEVRRREAREEELRRNESQRVGLFGVLETHSGAVRGAADTARNARHWLGGVGDYVSHLGENDSFRATSSDDLRRERRMIRSGRAENFARDLNAQGSGNTQPGFFERFRLDQEIMEGRGGAGIASFLGALAPMDSRAREGELRDMRRASQTTNTFLNATRQESSSAARHRDQTFGGSAEARMAFTQSMAGIMNDYQGPGGLGAAGTTGINALFRGGARFLTRDFIDPGNVAGPKMARGQDMENAYVRAMQQAGVGGDEASIRRNWQQRSSVITADISPLGRAMMTDEAIDRARDTARRDSQLRASISSEQLRRAETDSYRKVLGDSATGVGSESRRRAFDKLMTMVGTGKGDTQQQKQLSRDYQAAMVMLMRTNNNPSQRQAVQQRMQQIHRQMERSGMRTDDINASLEHARTIAQETRGDSDIQDLSRHMDLTSGTPHQALEHIRQADEGRLQVETQRKMSRGAIAMAGLEGERGALFRDVGREGGAIDLEKLQSNIEAIAGDSARLSSLRSKDRGLAQLVQAAAGGGEGGARARRAIEARMMGQGESSDRLHQEYRNFNWASRAIRSMFTGGEEGYVRRRLPGGTQADEAAANQNSDVDATQRAAENAGMGGSNDMLMTAAQELRRAAELLSGTAQNQQMDNLIGGNNGQ